MAWGRKTFIDPIIMGIIGGVSIVFGVAVLANAISQVWISVGEIHTLVNTINSTPGLLSTLQTSYPTLSHFNSLAVTELHFHYPSVLPEDFESVVRYCLRNNIKCFKGVFIDLSNNL